MHNVKKTFAMLGFRLVILHLFALSTIGCWHICSKCWLPSYVMLPH